MSDAPRFYIVNQHIGWLKQYVGGMDASNWRDMQAQAERQLENLSIEIEKINAALPIDAQGALEPDFCFDPDEWEYTIDWKSRADLAESCEVQPDEVKLFKTLVRGPDKFCVVVAHEYRWFDNEAEARAVAGLPLSDLFAPSQHPSTERE